VSIERFTLPYSAAAVADLRSRLLRTRWPDQIAGSGWQYGADVETLREICRYWAESFDWQAQVTALSAFDHYRFAAAEGGIHFIRAPGRGPAPMPLVITHGWPGSFLEMLKIIPLLADPAHHGGDASDAFDVIVPSLPGYGFSERPRRRGMNVFRIAELWIALMQALGHERFAAQGGDFGASVSTVLGLRHPGRVIGIHLNYVPGTYRPPAAAPEDLSPAEREFLAEAARWSDESYAYGHLQGTEPQTLAIGLNDSPAALAGWILSKFRDWSDCGGELARRFTMDELLANVTLYWMTETIHSSCRLYYEVRRAPLHFQPGDFVSVPCGIARFAKEAPFPPRRWVERGYDVRRWTEFPRGGHFAALEEPELLAGDIRAFFRPLRALHAGA
jgi:pimeloyl-ACP methyl ester carboxylesterase